MTQQKIVVLGTGGTIAGTSKAGDPRDYVAAQRGVTELLGALPAATDSLAAFEIVAEQVAQIDSKDMELTVWQQLAQRCLYWLAQAEVKGLVITHGTDTLEETAWFLQSVLPSRELAVRPVVLTCAMRPATALVPDGPQNLLDALTVAGAPGAGGVLAVCAGTIHGAREVRKAHTYRLDAFDSGDAGPLGYVEGGRIRKLRPWPEGLQTQGLVHAQRLLAALPKAPRVEILMSHTGARGDTADALVRAGVRGLVVAGTGNGTLHHALEAALCRAQADGVAVLRSTRCAEGVVRSHGGETLPAADDLSPVKARISLMLSLLASAEIPALK